MGFYIWNNSGYLIDIFGTALSYTYNASGIRTEKTVNGVTTEYYLDGSSIVAEKTGTDVIWYLYDGMGLAGFELNGTSYYYVYNGQGDVIGILDSSGNRVVTYTYDSWGSPLSVTGSRASTVGQKNPIRYRGYYYDTETGLYLTGTRYYDPVVGRWISGDSEMSGVGGELLGYNLFAYCFNNPVNMNDPSGHWPKWLTGAINVVGGALQAVAGAALVAAAPVSGGLSAVVGGALLINGAATIAAGAGQIINDVSNSNVMPEENALKTSAKAIGKALGGDTGEKVAGGVYDVANTAATVYSGTGPAKAATDALHKAGIIGKTVPISKVLNNPLDEFVTIGPKAGKITEYCHTIVHSGYGKIYAISLPNGFYQLTDAHHRVAALRSLGYETIKIYITK